MCSERLISVPIGRRLVEGCIGFLGVNLSDPRASEGCFGGWRFQFVYCRIVKGSLRC